MKVILVSAEFALSEDATSKGKKYLYLTCLNVWKCLYSNRQMFYERIDTHY